MRGRSTDMVMHIYGAENGIKGEFRHLFSEELIPFGSVSEFIFKAELMMEALDCPSASGNSRKNRGKYGEEQEKLAKSLKLLTAPFVGRIKGEGESFLISVMYRQNFSWQGHILRLGKRGCRITFRSVLELIMILEHSLCIGRPWEQQIFFASEDLITQAGQGNDKDAK